MSVTFQFVIYVYSNCDCVEHCSKRDSGLRVIGLPAMGKSPAKWIKTVLFGKKSSKPNISKGREVRMHNCKTNACTLLNSFLMS